MRPHILASATFLLSLSCCAKTDNPPKVPGSCELGDTYDSHVFAISWQGGFCRSKSDKPECRNLSNEPFAKRNFTLHGLWPNKTSCGTDYDFCGDVKTETKDFCSFPSFPLDSATRVRLDSLMPSAKYGSCLERHEWWKHGTCRDTSASDYYEVALSLLHEIDSSAFVRGFIASNIGKTVSLSAFNAAFDSAFGEGARFKMAANCKQGLLVELRMNLPKDLDGRFVDLISKADRMRKGSCKERFLIVETP